MPRNILSAICDIDHGKCSDLDVARGTALGSDEADAGVGTTSVTLLRLVLAALKQTGSTIADSLAVVQRSIASLSILAGRSIVRITE